MCPIPTGGRRGFDILVSQTDRPGEHQKSARRLGIDSRGKERVGNCSAEFFTLTWNEGRTQCLVAVEQPYAELTPSDLVKHDSLPGVAETIDALWREH